MTAHQKATGSLFIGTTHHELRLIGGLLRVTFTATETAVHISLSGCKAKPFERRKLREFMRPLVDAYSHDRRPIEIAGEHSQILGHVVPVERDGWVAFETRAEAKQ